MSEHRHLGKSSSSSFVDANAQPPTPIQTPTSATFATPISESPASHHGPFAEVEGLTPRFAEEYSVFNTTPGNLRGSQASFPDFLSTIPADGFLGHKRLLSAEALTAATLVPVFNPVLRSAAANSLPQLETPPRGALAASEPTQLASPPPTARALSPGPGRKLVPEMNMQKDQIFGHSDFHDSSHQSDMTALMDGVGGDMFGYPMSAPAAVQPSFWDPSMSLYMDVVDFSIPGPSLFQPPASSSHRHTGSFDWSSEFHLFQDPSGPPPPSNQENAQPLAAQESIPTPTSATYAPAAMDDPFGIAGVGDVVDPGLLFSQPPGAPSSLDPGVGHAGQTRGAEAAIAEFGKGQAGDVRRSSSHREPRNTSSGGRGPDRASARSPVKSAGRPGLKRSVSDSRGRRSIRRGSLPVLAPAMKSANGGYSLMPSHSTGRVSGRISPFKTQQRLSSLAAIPEISPQSRPRTAVRLTIDAHGRAHTIQGPFGGGSAITRSRSSHDVPRHRRLSPADEDNDDDDDDDTDDEPIIIPSRVASFNASFALPDPRKPVGSMHYSSRRSTSVGSDRHSANDAESEAETIVHEDPAKCGNAASELQRLVEDRQNQSFRSGAARTRRLFKTNKTNPRNFPGGIISPTSLTESSYGPDSYGVRCVCSSSKADESDGFMLQCESCEMWLHGRCINITRRTMPSVYICGFCAHTPNTTRRRLRDYDDDNDRENALGIGTAESPLASKSFRSFR